MAVQYLFDSNGMWIAFRVGKYVFNEDGDWIGWTPWDDGYVVTVDGDYLGTIYGENRLYRFLNAPYRGYPGYSGYPGYPGYPGYRGFAGYAGLPGMAEDVSAKFLKRRR